MNLLGFNISITRSAPPEPETPVSTLSPEALAWLGGAEANLDRPAGTVLANAYQQVVWVYRAVNALAEQVANVPFLFSAGQRGRENLITSGPLLNFYTRPHPQINAFAYWELRVMWLMLRGECMRIPIYSDGATAAFRSPNSKIKNILILDPGHFQHIVEDHKLLGWRYMGAGPFAPLDSQVFLPEEVWFEKLPNPFDFWRGMSPLSVAGLAARTDFASAAFMHGIIDNNADAGVIVRTDQQLDDQQREQIRATITNRKRRAGTADRPILLWGVNEIVKPTLSSADLQFLENRKFTRGEICSAFGVPEEIVTTTDHNKYDVMSGARLNFIENRVTPLCRRLEAEENATTIPALLAGNPIENQKSKTKNAVVGWFDLEALPIMQEALRKRLASAKVGFDMGIPFNELNQAFDLGFKPLPWGDTGYLPSKYQPLSSTLSSTSSPTLSASAPDRAAENPSSSTW